MYSVFEHWLRKPSAQFGFNVSCMRELAAEYQKTKIIHGYLSPALLFFLFDYGFDVDHLERRLG